MKIKLLIFIMFLGISTNVFVSANSVMLQGDINDDDKVDLFDLELLADNWLAQNSSVNLGGSNVVDLRDFQILANNWQREAPKLIINEFLASNSNVLADEDGDYSDWIEIRNQSSVAVNLDGLYLTDKQDELAKWAFPAMEILPGELLIVFASEKDRRIAGEELHTNFKLKATGEFLALVNSNGKVEHGFIPVYPTQQENISFGLYLNQQFYFTVPTPNSDNNMGFRALVDNPGFSIDRGFFEEAIIVEINCNTPYAFIKYTIDGSEPSESNGLYYSQPIAIDATTVLRAAAFRSQYVPSEIVTSTYIYPEDVLNQSAVQNGYPNQWQTRIHEGNQSIDTFQADFEMDPAIVNHPAYGPQLIDALKSLPTISLVTDIDNLFDLETGIYIHAVEPAGNIYGDVSLDWERPTSVELIYPDGQAGFQVDAGLRMQGSASRRPMNPKHSFRLLFKDEYGPGRLKFPLFGDNAASSFNTLALRGGFNDSFTIWAASQSGNATFLSDQFARDSHMAMGNPAAHGTFVHLYINGLYWGLYNPSERLDSDFQADYLGGAPEDYDVIKHKVQVIDGNKDAWNTAIALAGQGLSTWQAYDDIQEYIDVQSNADYMLLNFFLGTTDWPGNNWYMARNSVAGTGFKCFIWDAEQSLKSITSDRTGVNNSNSPAFFYDKLRANEEYRVLFGDRAHKFLFNGGALTPEKCQERYSHRINEISAAIIAESARWGDAHVNPAYNLNDDWLPKVNFVMNDLFPARGAILLAQLRNKGLYPGIDAPSFLVNDVYQHGGYISAGDKLTINYNQTADDSGSWVYYSTDGSDPRLVGGAICPDARKYTSPLALNSSFHIKARTYDNGSWSALCATTYAIGDIAGNLRITELMYHPANPDTEFIEICNIGSAALNLNLVKFTNGIDYTFEDSILNPGQYGIVIQDSAAFANKYGTSLNVIGQYTGRLDNDRDHIKLIDAMGGTIADFTYEDSWYELTDGAGYSLTLIDPVSTDPGELANMSSWRASSIAGGTPGSQ